MSNIAPDSFFKIDVSKSKARLIFQDGFFGYDFSQMYPLISYCLKICMITQKELVGQIPLCNPDVI